jgi:signal peptidase I
MIQNRVLLALAVVCLGICGCDRRVMRNDMQSTAMFPTIEPGERIIIDHGAYASTPPRRWDVVLYTMPEYPDLHISKRVIALPLETISCTSTGIVVDGMLLKMPDSLSNVVYCPPEQVPQSSAKFVSFPYQVPAGHYFVVGDNWTNSFDSRYYGAIPVSNIDGRVEGK